MTVAKNEIRHEYSEELVKLTLDYCKSVIELPPAPYYSERGSESISAFQAKLIRDPDLLFAACLIVRAWLDGTEYRILGLGLCQARLLLSDTEEFSPEIRQITYMAKTREELELICQNLDCDR